MYHVILRTRIQRGQVLVLVHDAALHGKIAVTAADLRHHAIRPLLPFRPPLIREQRKLPRLMLRLQCSDADADGFGARLLPHLREGLS